MDNNEKNLNNANSEFSYRYSAKEQAELKKIREKYTTPIISEEENKMDRLRKLDASVTKTARVVAICFGVIGSLVLGFGMSLCMTDLYTIFGESFEDSAMIAGIIIGVFGGALASFAYPTYMWIVKRKRTKLAPEIIRLTDELLK